MTESNLLQYALLSPFAYPPCEPAYEHSAGVDLRSCYNHIVSPLGSALVSTELQLQLPRNCYGRIAARSGLASKHCISVGGGVVDPNYTGEIKIILFNHSPTTAHYVRRGDRVAQLVCELYVRPTLLQVASIASDGISTFRGSKGFGSSD
jgi:dUTP pyrophosphatase